MTFGRSILPVIPAFARIMGQTYGIILCCIDIQHRKLIEARVRLYFPTRSKTCIPALIGLRLTQL